jgi:hypothetical protein
MTDERFDALTKQLTAASSRRGVLKGGLALALGGLATRLRGGNADARARIKMACAREGQPCSVLRGATANPVCCPHLVCDCNSGVCVSPSPTCAPTGPFETCVEGPLGIVSCANAEQCAQVENVDGGCACIERFCGFDSVPVLCQSGADCPSGLCVSVPGCCGDIPAFCAVPCGQGSGGTMTVAGARTRGAGGWQH